MSKLVLKKILTPNGVFEREVFEHVTLDKVVYTEKCVSCGCDTMVNIATPYSQRNNYIDGAGQTCGCLQK